jgi:hypothetical protein
MVDSASGTRVAQRVEEAQADHRESEEVLRRTITRLQTKKPQLFTFGESFVKKLTEAELDPFSDRQTIEFVAEQALISVQKRDASWTGKFAAAMSKIAPLASIALGITSFAGEVRSVYFVRSTLTMKGCRCWASRSGGNWSRCSHCG